MNLHNSAQEIGQELDYHYLGYMLQNQLLIRLRRIEKEQGQLISEYKFKRGNADTYDAHPNKRIEIGAADCLGIPCSPALRREGHRRVEEAVHTGIGKTVQVICYGLGGYHCGFKAICRHGDKQVGYCENRALNAGGNTVAKHSAEKLQVKHRLLKGKGVALRAALDDNRKNADSRKVLRNYGSQCNAVNAHIHRQNENQVQ